MARLFLVALLVLQLDFAWASDWKATQIRLPGSVSRSVDLPIAFCAGGTCTTTDQPGLFDEGSLATNGLPDGHESVLQHDGNSPKPAMKAYYGKPTTRYDHGILGDAIEAGALHVALPDGADRSLVLPKHQVFEDRTPRLLDLDGFGVAHAITILSDVSKGASLAVFNVDETELRLVAQTPYVGLPNRWRNIAGIDDFDGDGSVEIAEVVTPHIGGTLKFWRWSKGTLSLTAEQPGFSNHAIGAREQRLSAIEDFDNDGVSDLALPGNDRRSLNLVRLSRGAEPEIQIIASVQLPSPIDKAIATKREGDAVVVTVGLEDGSVWAIHR